MAGLYKLIALFVMGAAALAYANNLDVSNRYPAIDTMFWFCVFGAGSLAIRAFVELVHDGSKQGDHDEVSGSR